MREDVACVAWREELAWYVAGTLAPDRRAEVERHVVGCDGCGAALDEWRRLASATQAAAREGVAAQAPFDVSWALLAARLPSAAPTVVAMPATQRRVGRSMAALHAMRDWMAHLAQMGVAQRRLLHPAVWLASAAGIALVWLYAALAVGALGRGDILTFGLPLIAGAGMAFIYGPEADSGLELALATPTSARMVLLSRFALVLAYDTALSLLATLALAQLRMGAFFALAEPWLGPMALLAALGLVCSLLFGSVAAVGGTAAFWLTHTLRFAGGSVAQFAPAMLWRSSPQVWALALALICVAVVYVPRQQRFTAQP